MFVAVQLGASHHVYALLSRDSNLDPLTADDQLTRPEPLRRRVLSVVGV